MVRDPGGNLLAGHAPVLEPAARPLTQAGGARGRGTRQDATTATSTGRIAHAVPRLSRQRSDRRLALAAGLRHRRHRGDLDDRGVRDAALLLDQLRGDRRLRRAVARRRADVGDVAVAAAAAVRPAAAARRLHARAPDQRRRHGDDLPRPARAAEAADGDQDPEEAGRHRRVRPPLRARGAAREPAAAPEHGRDLRFRPHARRPAVLRDGVPRRRDARRAGRALGTGAAGTRRSTCCDRWRLRCARHTCTA